MAHRPSEFNMDSSAFNKWLIAHRNSTWILNLNLLKNVNLKNNRLTNSNSC